MLLNDPTFLALGLPALALLAVGRTAPDDPDTTLEELVPRWLDATGPPG